MTAFTKGIAKVPGSGRRSGARHKISTRFLEDFAAMWEAKGTECLRIMAAEHPTDFVRVAASLLPKELDLVDGRLQDVSDTELDAIISHVKAQLSLVRGFTRTTDSREESPTAH